MASWISAIGIRWTVTLLGLGRANFQTMSLSSGGSFGKRVNSLEVMDMAFSREAEVAGVLDSMLAESLEFYC
jgi:hypothetical protein